LYIKVIINLNNLHLCLILLPKQRETKRKLPKPITNEKKGWRRTKTPQLHTPGENLTTGYLKFPQIVQNEYKLPQPTGYSTSIRRVFSWLGRAHQWMCRLGVCLAGMLRSPVKGVGYGDISQHQCTMPSLCCAQGSSASTPPRAWLAAPAHTAGVGG